MKSHFETFSCILSGTTCIMWVGRCFELFGVSLLPLFFHPHTKLPLVLRFLPSPSLLLSPSDFTGTWPRSYRGFDSAQTLSMPSPAISASNIRLHEDNPLFPPPASKLLDFSVGTIFIFTSVQPPSPTATPRTALRSLCPL